MSYVMCRSVLEGEDNHGIPMGAKETKNKRRELFPLGAAKKCDDANCAKTCDNGTDDDAEKLAVAIDERNKMAAGAAAVSDDEGGAAQTREMELREEMATRAQNKARNYLADKKIFPLLSFMAGHLLTQEPEDPLSFLLDLVRRCIDFRDLGAVPPLLFSAAHLGSLCGSLAGPHAGLTDQQFHRGMSTVAIQHYKIPAKNEHGLIEHADFIAAAQEALKDDLLEMLRTPRKLKL